MVGMKYQFILLFLCISVISLVDIIADKLHKSPVYEFDAPWISIGTRSEVMYARTKLKLQGRVEKAVLSVEALDEFEIWINGDKVGGDTLPDTVMSARYTIHKHLNPGNNIIGIKSASHSKSKAVALRAELKYQDGEGLHRLVSDHSWQVASVWEPYDSADNATWSKSFVKTSKWKTPNVIADTYPAHRVSIGLPNYVNIFDTHGHWFWPAMNSPNSTQLTKTFNLDLESEISLGVAVNGSYTIYVNEKKVELLNATQKIVELIDISPYIIPGENRVELAVHSEEVVPRMAIIGYMREGNRVLNLSSPQQWVESPELIYESISDNFPSITYKRPGSYLKYTAVLAVQWLKSLLILMLAVAFIYILHTSTADVKQNQFIQWINSVCIVLALAWFALLFISKLELFQADAIFVNATLISLLALLASYQLFRFWGESA